MLVAEAPPVDTEPPAPGEAVVGEEQLVEVDPQLRREIEEDEGVECDDSPVRGGQLRVQLATSRPI